MDVCIEYVKLGTVHHLYIIWESGFKLLSSYKENHGMHRPSLDDGTFLIQLQQMTKQNYNEYFLIYTKYTCGMSV
jgi:hypothetical protein